LNKNTIVGFCDKTIEVFIYILIFCLPFSKAIIETSAGFIISAWIVKRIFSGYAASTGINLLGRFKPVSTYLNKPITAYIFALFLSVVFSSRFGLSLHNFFAKTMEYIMLYFIVAEFVSDKAKLKNTVMVMLVSAAMIGLDAIFQYYTGFDFLRHRNLEAGRITASFQMPGDLAGYLGPLLCLSLAFCLVEVKRSLRRLLILQALVLTSLLIVSLARGAWLGFIIAVFYLGIVQNKKIFFIAIVTMIILAVVVPNIIKPPDNILEHFRSIFIFSPQVDNLNRMEIWRAAVRMIKDKPLFGHGLSTFMSIFPRYGKDYYYLKEGIIPYAHNAYLQMAAESGIVGLASFLWLIAAFFINTIRSLKKMQDKFHHAVLAGISAGIIATLVHSGVDTNLQSLQLSVLFWFMLGLNASLQREVTFEKAKH
jgi:O-antigen ligase